MAHAEEANELDHPDLPDVREDHQATLTSGFVHRCLRTPFEHFVTHLYYPSRAVEPPQYPAPERRQSRPFINASLLPALFLPRKALNNFHDARTLVRVTYDGTIWLAERGSVLSAQVNNSAGEDALAHVALHGRVLACADRRFPPF
jgi:hypothetical protein